MFQKNSYLVPSDKCGVWWVSVIHLYGGFFRKVSNVGDFVKVSVKKTRPDNWLKKKTKTKGIVVRSRKELFKSDGSTVSFSINNIVLLKKRTTPHGSVIFGPTIKNLKRKKFLTSFPGVI
jgi:large subunit ribosomal protein L14